jgi:hypothetical protein
MSSAATFSCDLGGHKHVDTVGGLEVVRVLDKESEEYPHVLHWEIFFSPLLGLVEAA